MAHIQDTSARDRPVVPRGPRRSTLFPIENGRIGPLGIAPGPAPASSIASRAA